AEHEDFAVSDLAGLGGSGNGGDDFVDLFGRYRDLDLELRQEAHGVFGAAIDFGVAFLTPIAFDFGHGQPLHSCRSEGVTNLVELEWLDDGHDDFHGFDPRLSPFRSIRSAGIFTEHCRANALHGHRRGTGNQTPCQMPNRTLAN